MAEADHTDFTSLSCVRDVEQARRLLETLTTEEVNKQPFHNGVH